jgi:DNA-binding NarL/FixJ family response regulator
MIVDCHAIVREGLEKLIGDRRGLQVIAEADNRSDSLVLAERDQPDIILMDLDFPDDSGLDILANLLKVASKARVLVLTGVRDLEMHRQAMLLGAMGVVQKDKNSDFLFKAIEKVHAGEIWYDRSKMGSMFTEILRNEDGRKTDPEAAKIASLSQRERDVIKLISQGMKNRVIGETLFISETTVRHHLTAIFEKLGVSSRLELIIYALSRGLATLPETGYSSNGAGGARNPPQKIQTNKAS